MQKDKVPLLLATYLLVTVVTYGALNSQVISSSTDRQLAAVYNNSTGQSAKQSMIVTVTDIKVSVRSGVSSISNEFVDGKTLVRARFPLFITPTGGSVTLYRGQAGMYLKDEISGRTSSYSYASHLYLDDNKEVDKVKLPADKTTLVTIVTDWDNSTLFGGYYRAFLQGIYFSSIGQYVPLDFSSPKPRPLLVTGETSPYISAVNYKGPNNLDSYYIELFGVRLKGVKVLVYTCDADAICRESEPRPVSRISDDGKLAVLTLPSGEFKMMENIKVENSNGRSNSFSRQLMEPSGAPSRSIQVPSLDIDQSANTMFIRWADSLEWFGRRNYDLALLKGGQTIPTGWSRGGYDWGCNGILNCSWAAEDRDGRFVTVSIPTNLPGSDYRIRVCPSGGVPCAQSPNFTIGEATTDRPTVNNLPTLVTLGTSQSISWSGNSSSYDVLWQKTEGATVSELPIRYNVAGNLLDWKVGQYLDANGTVQQKTSVSETATYRIRVCPSGSAMCGSSGVFKISNPPEESGIVLTGGTSPSDYLLVGQTGTWSLNYSTYQIKDTAATRYSIICDSDFSDGLGPDATVQWVSVPSTNNVCQVSRSFSQPGYYSLNLQVINDSLADLGESMQYKIRVIANPIVDPPPISIYPQTCLTQDLTETQANGPAVSSLQAFLVAYLKSVGVTPSLKEPLPPPDQAYFGPSAANDLRKFNERQGLSTPTISCVDPSTGLTRNCAVLNQASRQKIGQLSGCGQVLGATVSYPPPPCLPGDIYNSQTGLLCPQF